MSLCKKKTILGLSILVLMSIGLITLSVSNKTPKTNSADPMEGIVVDGTITEAEWEGCDWKVGFYLDIDDVGNPPDTDGNNYLYLGEDLNNLYIGLDLCSDKTGGTNGEWVSVWLNTNNRSFSDAQAWESYYDDGVESLMYDVENDQEWKFLSNTISGFQSTINDDSEYSAIYGNIDGNKADMDYLDALVFNITAENVGGYYISRVEFNVDFKVWYNDFFDGIFLDNIQRVNFQIYTSANTTILEHYLYLAYNNGTINNDDQNQIRELSTSTSQEMLQFNYGPGNLSATDIMKFVLYANSTSPFLTGINSLHITPYNNMTNHVATVTYPYTSISNYDIEWFKREQRIGPSDVRNSNS